MKRMVGVLALLVGCGDHMVESEDVDFGRARSAFFVQVSGADIPNFIYMATEPLECEDLKADLEWLLRPLVEKGADCSDAHAYFRWGYRAHQSALMVTLPDSNVRPGHMDVDGDGLEMTVGRFDCGESSQQDVERWTLVEGELDVYRDDADNDTYDNLLIGGVVGTLVDERGATSDIAVEFHAKPCRVEVEVGGSGTGGGLGALIEALGYYFGW